MTQQEARLQIARLVDQRKYEEALPILEDLLEKNPSDREFAIYRLLVVRMLIAHWTLSRVDAGELGALWPVAKQVFRRSVIAALRACAIAKGTRAVGECYRTARAKVAAPHAKPVVAGGAGFALIIALSTLFMAEGNKMSGQAAADAVTAVVSHSATVVAEATDATVDGARGALSLAPEGLSQLASGPDTESAAVEKGPEAIESKVAWRNDIPSKIMIDAPSARGKPEVAAVKERLAPRATGRKTVRKILGQVLSERAIPIRKAPRFAAASVRDIDRGILLNVLEYVGSWARVELSPSGVTGFVRKEFLVSVGSQEPRATRRSRSVSRTTEPGALSSERL